LFSTSIDVAACRIGGNNHPHPGLPLEGERVGLLSFKGRIDRQRATPNGLIPRSQYMMDAKPSNDPPSRHQGPPMKTPMFLILLLLPVAAWCAPQLLHPKIIKRMDQMGDVFLAPEFCGNVVRISYDQRKIGDGAPGYFDNTTGNLIVACPNPRQNFAVPPALRVCPPAAWKCKGMGAW
jgi:hypothetical protein